MIYKKRFGQHFLRDLGVINQIVNVVHPKRDDHIVEIGPGDGALTKHLLPLLDRLDVVEIDRDLVGKLKAHCVTLGSLNVHLADALYFDFQMLIRIQKKEKLRVVGNLPYNIASQLIFHLLEFASHIQDMHFMLQKEVADRLVAKPGCKAYGRLSVMVQYFCQVEKLFEVSPEAFQPKPKVDSAIVCFIPYVELPYQAKDFNLFTHIVKQAFSQRRKMLRNVLCDIMNEEAMRNIGIDPDLRAENLSIQDFVSISNHL